MTRPVLATFAERTRADAHPFGAPPLIEGDAKAKFDRRSYSDAPRWCASPGRKFSGPSRHGGRSTHMAGLAPRPGFTRPTGVMRVARSSRL